MRWRMTDGDSIYNGLRLGLNKRFSRNFQAQVSYTYSKSIDDSSTFTGSTDFGDADRTAYLGQHERGLSAFDVTQSFFTNFVYELPGSQWTGAAGKVLGGWSLSGVLRLHSGNPINPDATQPQVKIGSTTFSTNYVDGSNLNLNPGGNQNPVHAQNPENYFDASQYAYLVTNCMNLSGGSPCGTSLPTGFFQGNLGRNVLRSPGVANLDATLSKTTKLGWLGESGGLEFRAEFYNLFNRVNFGLPNLTVFDQNGILDPTAGQITTTRTNSRQMQLAVRIQF